MTVATETPTLQSFIRDVIATGENDPAKIANKTLHAVIGHRDAETILFHAVYQVAKEEYRSYVRDLSRQMVADNSPVADADGEPAVVRLRSTVTAKGPTKQSKARDQWLAEKTWFPDIDRWIDNGAATTRNHQARARYLHDQLMSHSKTVNREITVHHAAVRLINAHHVKCLNEVPGFTRAMLAEEPGDER